MHHFTFPDPFPPGNDLVEAPEANTLLLDYQQLDIAETYTRVGWTFDASRECRTTFELQGFPLSLVRDGVMNLQAPAFKFTVQNSTTAVIPSDQLRNSTDFIVYRLVAVDENGTICSLETVETFYHLDSEYDYSVQSPLCTI